MQATKGTKGGGRIQSTVTVVASAAVALSIGELAAGAVQVWQSPIEAVADAVIDLSPPRITKFGIQVFGTNDKLALIIGILLTLLLVAVAVGVLARKRAAVAYATFAGLAVVGVTAASRGTSSPIEGVPALLAGLAGAGAVFALRRISPALDGGTDERVESVVDAAPPVVASGGTRRTFFLVAGSFVAAAGVAAAGGRALASRFSAAASRAAVRLPRPASPLPAPPEAIAVDVEGMTPFYTPNDTFYRIDTALIVPQVPAETWSLRVKGMVDEEIELSWDDITSRSDLIEVDITLTCVSNQVGGELVGNARWLGVRLRDLLDEAGVKDGADQVVGRSADGYTCGFPIEAAYDRDAIVAIGMNGEPLPLEHGFPARLVTPGLYGYVSATKWLTEIEVTTFADFEQYWVPRGYAEKAPIKTMTRIDVPRTGQIIDAGPYVLAGVAWAQTKGITKVEVSIDDAPFQEATLAEERSVDTWRQWSLPWEATTGSHRITVRSTDGTGALQQQEREAPLPDGAAGWQERLVVVRSAS